MTRSFDSAALHDALAAQGQMQAFARALVADEHRARDLVQHAWLRLIEQGVRDNARGFLRRVIRNRAIDELRTGGRRARREQARARPEAVPAADEMLAREQLRRRLADAVAALDEPYRTTVWLRYFEALEPREVARRMDVPVETVRTRTRRALDRLRTELDQEYGDRRAWTALALPLLGPTNGIPIITAVLGILMTHKLLATAVLAAAISLLWTAAAVFTAPSDPPAPRTDKASALTGSIPDPPPAPAATTRAQLAVPPAERVATVLSGHVRFADGTPAASREFWLWREPRPRQAWLPQRGSRLGHPAPDLREHDGTTDEHGRWTHVLGEGERVFGITLRYADHVLVSHELEAGRPDVVLPEPGRITVRVEGASPERTWLVRAYPGQRVVSETIPDAAEWAMTLVDEAQTDSGLAVYFVERVRRELRADETLEIVAPRGVGFGVDIEGRGFEVADNERFVEAPSDAVFVVSTSRPMATIEIVEGGARADIGGHVFLDEGAGRWNRYLEMAGGHLEISGDYDPDRDYPVIVLLDDAEHFATTLRFGPVAERRVVRLARGAGEKREQFALPAALGDALAAVVIELDDGSAERAVEVPHQFFSRDGSPYSFAAAGERVFVSHLPDSWSRVYLCADDGRLWRCDRNDRAPRALAPARSVNVDLDAVRERHRAADYGSYQLELLWRSRDRLLHVPLRRLRFDPAAGALGAWTPHLTTGFDVSLVLYSGRQRIEVPLR